MLNHEAIDYIREMKRRASRETSLERLTQTAEASCIQRTVIPATAMYFRMMAVDLPIRSDLVADAFAALPEQE